VFNGAGKVDILLRLADHNVMVAECKFWRGIKSFEEALEQLEGYLTLRDTRAALIFFVTGKDVDGPLVEAEEYIASLPGAERLDGAIGETVTRTLSPEVGRGPFDAQYDAETAAVGGNTEHPEGTRLMDRPQLPLVRAARVGEHMGQRPGAPGPLTRAARPHGAPSLWSRRRFPARVVVAVSSKREGSLV
jgi:hypothetical protein